MINETPQFWKENKNIFVKSLEWKKQKQINQLINYVSSELRCLPLLSSTKIP